MVVPFTGVKSRLREAIGDLVPRETPTDFRKAASLIRAIAADIPDVQLYLMSDGAFDTRGIGEAPAAKLHYVKCGGAAENVGITAIDARRCHDHG